MSTMRIRSGRSEEQVGAVMRRILVERAFPLDEVRFSPRSARRHPPRMGGRAIIVETRPRPTSRDGHRAVLGGRDLLQGPLTRIAASVRSWSTTPRHGGMDPGRAPRRAEVNADALDSIRGHRGESHCTTMVAMPVLKPSTTRAAGAPHHRHLPGGSGAGLAGVAELAEQVGQDVGPLPELAFDARPSSSPPSVFDAPSPQRAPVAGSS